MESTGSAASDPLVEAARERGLPAAEVRAIALRIAGRVCGDCDACCTIKAVRELGKPSQAACRHLCQTGCAIYDQRPKSCREYACLWRQGYINGDECWRPDQLGVVIDYEPFVRIPGTVLLVVWEIVPGAAESQHVRHVIDQLLAAHKQIKAVAYCAAGQQVQHDFPIDREAYPGDDVPPAPPIFAFDQARGVATYQFRKAG